MLYMLNIVAYADPSARLKKDKTATGDWLLRMEGEGLVREFHCGGLGTSGQYWWIPKHAADDRYDMVKKHAAKTILVRNYQM